ncbi:3-hydroxyisobutyrate dehydrogenase [Zooshikella marina]|uniref:3-hydroxyisobutyrate dehydrogenase n=1 Tax=Zooshikella ganghwensis TaxID=202772 RepID=UPI001BAE7F31|nr:3-hydroxyisobutyrate dehydrogenase [Zooshikella ganghwensis]MBU2705721.1 3-hydroxyisobutyrate dehydrogenase [Zooshikella ganghwensis]
MDIGFIGLGQMGCPMAKNLINAGHRLRVYDLIPNAVDLLVKDGAEAAHTAHMAVENADVVISMLPAGEHVKQLYLEGNLLDSINTSTLVIDSSTIDPDSARLVASEAKKRGIRMLDAPVSGGTAGAQAGTLTFIVGGEADAVSMAKPILQVMGKNIFHAGANGAGQVAKICNNMLLAITMAGTAEALQLGVEQGLDPQVLADIMNNSSGGNWVLQRYNPYPGVMPEAPASHDYQGGFRVELMLKDLGLAEQMALSQTSRTPMGALARNLYSIHSAQGSHARDFSSIMQLYQRHIDE